MPYYAVIKGRQTGIFTTWDECKTQVNKFQGAKFKSFPTRELAVEFLKSPQERVKHSFISKTVPRQSSQSLSVKSLSSQSAQSPRDKPAQSLSDRLVVYTDGACSSNGTSSAKAGIGVYFGPDDPRNVSCPLPDVQGQHPTNNRAELYAVIKAMETVEEKCIIYTDSQYTVKGLTEWMPGWKKRGWTKADGKAVLNVDLWKRLDTIYDKHKHQIVHVKGHVGNHGNEMADRLAVQGCH